MPFAEPMLDAKQRKTFLKLVKKGMASIAPSARRIVARIAAASKESGGMKRGVKDVQKFIKKEAGQDRVCILASDISPMVRRCSCIPVSMSSWDCVAAQDVISHLPCLCEENDVPYVFIDSKEVCLPPAVSP